MFFRTSTVRAAVTDNDAATAAAAAEECTSPKMQPASSLAPAGRSLLFGGLANLFGSQNSTSCADEDESCAQWARDGECRKNAAFMTTQCAASCGTCGEAAASAPGRQLYTPPRTPRTRGLCADEAEYGCAAHWAYSDDVVPSDASPWLQAAASRCLPPP